MNVDEYRARMSAQEDQLSKNKELMRKLEELQDEMALDDRDSVAWIEDFERMANGIPGARQVTMGLWEDHYVTSRNTNAVLEESIDRVAGERRDIEDEIAALEATWRRQNEKRED